MTIFGCELHSSYGIASQEHRQLLHCQRIHSALEACSFRIAHCAQCSITVAFNVEACHLDTCKLACAFRIKKLLRHGCKAFLTVLRQFLGAAYKWIFQRCSLAHTRVAATLEIMFGTSFSEFHFNLGGGAGSMRCIFLSSEYTKLKGSERVT